MTKSKLAMGVVSTRKYTSRYRESESEVHSTCYLHDWLLQINLLRAGLNVARSISSAELSILIRTPLKDLPLMVQSSNMVAATRDVHDLLVKEAFN